MSPFRGPYGLRPLRSGPPNWNRPGRPGPVRKEETYLRLGFGRRALPPSRRDVCSSPHAAPRGPGADPLAVGADSEPTVQGPSRSPACEVRTVSSRRAWPRIGRLAGRVPCPGSFDRMTCDRLTVRRRAGALGRQRDPDVRALARRAADPEGSVERLGALGAGREADVAARERGGHLALVDAAAVVGHLE